MSEPDMEGKSDSDPDFPSWFMRICREQYENIKDEAGGGDVLMVVNSRPMTAGPGHARGAHGPKCSRMTFGFM
jgi:hypothetical protein